MSPAMNTVQHTRRDLHRGAFAARGKTREHGRSAQQHFVEHKTQRNQHGFTGGGRYGFKAAITWGMPLPAAPAAKRRVSQTTTAPPNGVNNNGSHQCCVYAPVNQRLAKSVILTKTTTATPVMTAPVQIRIRSIQRRGRIRR